MQKNTVSRKAFKNLLLPGLGYMFMGNIMAAIMTISLASFMGNSLLMSVAVLFALTIYFLLVAVPAYKNGQEEHALLSSKRVQSVPKNRWLCVGAISFVVAVIPSVLFIFRAISEGTYRLLSGAIYPLSLFMIEKTGEFVKHFQTGEPMEVTRMLSFAPYVFIGIYALTPLAFHIGFMLGLSDKLSGNQIMYK